MSANNEALARRWFEEVWNQGRESTIDELFPRDGVAHGLGDSEADVHGPAGFKPFHANLRGAMPDIHMQLDDVFATADRAAIRLTVTGTHRGPGLGIAPTGRKLSFQGIVILRIEYGRIVEAWNSYDQLGLLRQIGALPPPADRDRFLTPNSI